MSDPGVFYCAGCGHPCSHAGGCSFIMDGGEKCGCAEYEPMDLNFYGQEMIDVVAKDHAEKPTSCAGCACKAVRPSSAKA